MAGVILVQNHFAFLISLNRFRIVQNFMKWVFTMGNGLAIGACLADHLGLAIGYLQRQGYQS
jgi:hypothetical protein